jgi:hypothetical protein
MHHGHPVRAVVDDSSVCIWREPGWNVLGLQIEIKGGNAISVALTRDDARRLANALIEQCQERE